MKDLIHYLLGLKRYPPGHFYSAIPDVAEVRARRERIFDRSKREVPGVELNEGAQLALAERLAAHYPLIAAFPASKPEDSGARYYFENAFFRYTDACVLFGMIREFAPKRILEVGSGFSSALMLDANGMAERPMALTFVEPYPERLESLLRPEDKTAARILKTPVQDVPLGEFAALEADDVLFIDSSHVAKTGSDVHYLLFEVLPVLAPGVIVHFHDVPHPFEYPENWVMRGRSWNEAYFLRAFLQYNPVFEIAFFNSFMLRFQREWFAERMPLCLKDAGGSLWLRKRE